MIKVGEHITIDFLGVKKDYSPEFYEKVIYKIAKAAKVEILNVASHKFEPQGFTLVALLAESHFSFHTFPERGVISFDFFTCGKVNPKVALKILRNEIDHERVVTNAFDRSSIGLYDDIYSTPGQKKFYVVKDVLEKSQVCLCFSLRYPMAGRNLPTLTLRPCAKPVLVKNTSSSSTLLSPSTAIVMRPVWKGSIAPDITNSACPTENPFVPSAVSVDSDSVPCAWPEPKKPIFFHSNR